MDSSKIEKMKDELLEAELKQYNKEAVLELMQEWCMNIGDNIPLMRKARNLGEFHDRKSDCCIVVGAAPTLTDDEIMSLSHFSGDVIVTNKNFKRFVDLHIVPDWVCLLDAHPISLPQFSWMIEPCKIAAPPAPCCFPIIDVVYERTNFLVASVVYPQTLKVLMEFSDNVYGFNPYNDDGSGSVCLSKTWEWMNDKKELDHGGSVGCLAISLASLLRYKEVALMGFGLYDEPNPNWTTEESKQREWFYYPDVNRHVGLPRNFRAYLTFILFTVQESGWAKWTNLSESPFLTHSPLFEQVKLAEWLEDKEV